MTKGILGKRQQCVKLCCISRGDLLKSRGTEPRDCAEITAEFLEWNNSAKVDMSWERRVSLAKSVACEELGGKYQPVALDGLYV